MLCFGITLLFEGKKKKKEDSLGGLDPDSLTPQVTTMEALCVTEETAEEEK